MLKFKVTVRAEGPGWGNAPSQTGFCSKHPNDVQAALLDALTRLALEALKSGRPNPTKVRLVCWKGRGDRWVIFRPAHPRLEALGKTLCVGAEVCSLQGLETDKTVTVLPSTRIGTTTPRRATVLTIERENVRVLIEGKKGHFTVHQVKPHELLLGW